MLTGCDYILQTEKFTERYKGKIQWWGFALKYYRKERGTWDRWRAKILITGARW